VKAFSVGYKARMAAVNCGKKRNAQPGAQPSAQSSALQRICDTGDLSVLLTF
jgi:hypothetical protein